MDEFLAYAFDFAVLVFAPIFLLGSDIMDFFGEKTDDQSNLKNQIIFKSRKGKNEPYHVGGLSGLVDSHVDRGCRRMVLRSYGHEERPSESVVRNVHEVGWVSGRPYSLSWRETFVVHAVLSNLAFGRPIFYEPVSFRFTSFVDIQGRKHTVRVSHVGTQGWSSLEVGEWGGSGLAEGANKYDEENPSHAHSLECWSVLQHLYLVSPN
jgi:hypothetical protein